MCSRWKPSARNLIPHVHESIDSVERVDLPDQQVLEEVRRGYKIKDRLLRPALVRVVHNPSQKEI